MHKILACIITYNPNIEILERNINSYYDNVEEILIVDNGSNNKKNIEGVRRKKISYIWNKENKGIAFALNKGLEYARNKDYDYILTMDQDSYFEHKDSVKKMTEYFSENTTAIVAPCTKDMISGDIELFDNKINEVKNVITSGALCRIDILTKIGGWEEKMFIDSVDFELCFHLRKEGFGIYKINDVFLCHHLGESQIRKISSISLVITNHSYIRRYYQMRNSVYLFKKYFSCFPKDLLILLFSKIKTMFLIALFEKEDKRRKIRYAIRGWKDGVIGKFKIIK